MGDLTSDQLSDLRKDLGDDETPYTFSDTELERLFDRSDEDYDATLRLAFFQLLTNSAKFYDYVSGHTRQEQEKIFDHLKYLLTYLDAQLDGKMQVRIVGLQFIPPREIDIPNTEQLPRRRRLT